MTDTAEHPSPDGAFHILLAHHEVRMSHWIASASLRSTSPDALLLAVGGWEWSADTIAWNDDSRAVTLSMRCYPGDAPSAQLRLRPREKTAELDGAAMPFHALDAALEEFYRRNRRRSTLPG